MEEPIQVFGGSSSNQVATNTILETLTTEDRIVFRGEERPTPSPVTTEQWAYENTENGKISWYIYGADLTGAGLQTLGKLKDMVIHFSEFTSAGIGLYVTVYTAPLPDGNNAGSFYRSRINYQGDYSFVDPAADFIGASFTFGDTTPNDSEVIDGLLIQDVGLNYEPENSVGPQKNTEIISFIVLSTSSSQPAGTENWAIDYTQIDFRNDTYKYYYRTIGEDTPSLSNDPNWDIVNTDMLQFAGTINMDGPDILTPLEGASFILTATNPQTVTGVRIWQARTDTLVDPLTPPTTSNPNELLKLLQNRMIYPEDVMYFEVVPEAVGEAYVFSYASWNEISVPTNAEEFSVSIDLGGLS